MGDKRHPRWVRRTAVSKRGLKGALVVVEANAVGVCFSLTRRQAKRLATRVTSFRAYEGQLSYDGWPFFRDQIILLVLLPNSFGQSGNGQA